MSKRESTAVVFVKAAPEGATSLGIGSKALLELLRLKLFPAELDFGGGFVAAHPNRRPDGPVF